jgi:hypothetical protein
VLAAHPMHTLTLGTCSSRLRDNFRRKRRFKSRIWTDVFCEKLLFSVASRFSAR